MPPLSDYLAPGLRLVIVGFNPGTRSGELGHYYAHPNNQFWPLLHASGLVTEPLTYAEDARVLEWGIGLTDLVARSTRSAAELTTDDLRRGRFLLERNLIHYAPRVVAFNGKGAYERYVQRTCRIGAQDEPIGESRVFVMPSTSALAAIRREVKLGYFQQLKRLVDDVSREQVAS